MPFAGDMAIGYLGNSPTALLAHRAVVTRREIAALFLRLGTTSFGGSMLPLMEDAVVQRRRWLTTEQFTEGVALAELVPGPVALKVAAYVGHHARGLSGAAAAVVAFALPPFVLVLLASTFFFQTHQRLPLGSILTFVSPVVVGLLLATSWRLGRRNLARPSGWMTTALTILALAAGWSPLAILWGWGVLHVAWSALRERFAWTTS